MIQTKKETYQIFSHVSHFPCEFVSILGCLVKSELRPQHLQNLVLQLYFLKIFALYLFPQGVHLIHPQCLVLKGKIGKCSMGTIQSQINPIFAIKKTTALILYLLGYI